MCNNGSNDGCNNCARLEAENAQLRLHIRRLEDTIRKLREYIAFLLNLIYKVANYCERVIASSVALRHKGGLKPKSYHRLGGIIEMAEAVKVRLKRAGF